MKQTPLYTIIDDFLPADEFELMLEYVQRNAFARNPRWIKPWDLADEMPWQTARPCTRVASRSTPKISNAKRNAPFPRCAIAGFLLGEDGRTPFWR